MPQSHQKPYLDILYPTQAGLLFATALIHDLMTHCTLVTHHGHELLRLTKTLARPHSFWLYFATMIPSSPPVSHSFDDFPTTSQTLEPSLSDYRHGHHPASLLPQALLVLGGFVDAKPHLRGRVPIECKMYVGE